MRITTELGPADDVLAFCETYSAPPSAPWHIRYLSAVGRKPGGGADTPSLCGKKVAWDLNVPLTKHRLRSHQVTCAACRELFPDNFLEEIPQS